MEKFDFNEQSHRRLNILTGEYVLVSPHRSKRPWQGKMETVDQAERPAYDPKCYLCPGNTRAEGGTNPAYQGVYSFQNDFAALLKDIPSGYVNKNNLLVAESEAGICKVICFSPEHNLTLPEMKAEDIRKVVDLWCHEYEELGDRDDIGHVQIFENKGELMGCSNPHPHGQIWAQKNLPQEVMKEWKQQKKYYEEKERSLLGDYLELELKEQERVVVENNSFVVLVPFWAIWPYETIIISRRHCTNMLEFTGTERDDFADIIKKITIRYDNLFEISFPYSSGIHQSQTDGWEHPEWHFHMHFYPPLLRSASVRKFMVGYEMLANPQRDITPEASAKVLRELSTIHYKIKERISQKDISEIQI